MIRFKDKVDNDPKTKQSFLIAQIPIQQQKQENT